MTIPVKKLSNGFTIPVFGLGTWTMGGRFESDSSDDPRHITAIQQAIEAGISLIDTAEKYGRGHAEELVGISIQKFNRDKLFITSKVWPNHLRYKDVLTSCKNSLRRLKTEYVDLYLIHSPNDEIPIEETLQAFDELKDGGLIRWIGVSNFTSKRLRKAQQHTKNKIVVNQVLYNLIYRQPEKDGLVEYCRQNDVLLEAYRPIERGLLLNKDVKIMNAICDKYSKTPAQIAINWLLSQENVMTVAKMSIPDHLEENLGGIRWEMEEEDIETLRIQYPGQRINSDNPLR